MKKASPLRDQVAEYIREQIVSGRFRPGGRLPAFELMSKRFKVSRGTLSKVYKVLKEQGFLYSVPRRGMYISSMPPHMSRVALLFYHSPEQCCRNAFYNGLRIELERMNYIVGNKRVVIYYNINPEAQTPEYERLKRAISGSCLAGLIFTRELFNSVRKSFLRYKPEIPYVYISGNKRLKQIPSIDFNSYQLWKSGLDSLRKAGKSRIAIVDRIEGISYIKSEKRNLARDIPDKWMVAAPVTSPGSTEDLITLLFDYPDRLRPEAIFLGNDNFILPVVNALRKLKLEPMRDVLLLAYSLFPERIKISREVALIGHNVHDIITGCVEALISPREEVPDVQYIKTVLK